MAKASTHAVLSAEESAMSPVAWKRVPTTFAAIFGIAIPYRPPMDPISAFFWRKRMLFETTTGFVLFERWEKLLFLVVIYSILTLVAMALYNAPQYAMFLKERAEYYLLGEEPAASVSTQVVDWAVRNLTGEL